MYYVKLQYNYQICAEGSPTAVYDVIMDKDLNILGSNYKHKSIYYLITNKRTRSGLTILLEHNLPEDIISKLKTKVMINKISKL